MMHHSGIRRVVPGISLEISLPRFSTSVSPGTQKSWENSSCPYVSGVSFLLSPWIRMTTLLGFDVDKVVAVNLLSSSRPRSCDSPSNAVSGLIEQGLAIKDALPRATGARV